MTVNTTARELMDKGLWDKYCELSGMNPWAVNEGLDDAEQLVVPEDIAKKLQLI
ncbi:MAG: hypothetical protein KAS32_05285 [Candidatus Peribacteraceae bacterium]|nr:hypothetical protein [Candidatus Peribacteraceae bacterium]